MLENEIILTPSKGMVLCDGYSIAYSSVMMPSNGDVSVWKEMTEAEAVAIVERNATNPVDEEITGDELKAMIEEVL